jgi:hypothetical protein
VNIHRRDFITLLCGAAAAWPLTARAQQPERIRRIGVLMGRDENDPESKHRYSAFTQALADLGWTDGRNVRIDLRWGGTCLGQASVEGCHCRLKAPGAPIARVALVRRGNTG